MKDAKGFLPLRDWTNHGESSEEIKNLNFLGNDSSSDDEHGSSVNEASEKESEDSSEPDKTPHFDFATLKSEMGVQQRS